MKLNRKGFTLAELLIVVAIIGVLVAVSIPIFTGQLEKSRESADAALIRSAYAEVMAAAMEQSKKSAYYKDGVYRSGDIQLSQTQDEWQNEEVDKSLSSIGVQSGTPAVSGTVYVEYDPNKKEDPVTFYYSSNGSGASADPNQVYIDYNKFGQKVVTMGSGFYSDTDPDLTDEQKELAEIIKEQFGWDQVTVAYGNHSKYNSETKTGCVLVTVTDQDIDLSSGKGVTTKDTKRVFFDSKTGEVIAVWSQPGDWKVSSNGKPGFWGASNKQTVEYEIDRVKTTE